MTATTSKSEESVPPSKLFVRLWNTAAKRQDAEVRENFFSECVAGVLNADLRLARAVAYEINGRRDRIGGTSIRQSAIRVTPQFSCLSKGRRCYVDLRIDVGDSVSIGIETKLDAPEGTHPSGDRQLFKYLGIKSLTHFAYLTGYAVEIESKVLRAKRYLHPGQGREHFLWSDIYPLVAAAAKRRTAPQLAQALLELFHARHLEPAHPDLPDLGTPEGRLEFRDLWKTTSATLGGYYSDVADPRVNATMYGWNADGRNAWKIGLQPAIYPGLLRIWLFMANAAVRDRAVTKLRKEFKERRGAFRGATAEPRVGLGEAKAGISVFLPYRSIFPRNSSDASKQKRLASVVGTVVSSVNR
jgi:hypothetical protein